MTDKAKSNGEIDRVNKPAKTISPSLNTADVLLGRGTGFNEYKGNIRFRSIIEEHRHEYMTAQLRERKKKIAARVYEKIRSSGGRFLRPASGRKSSKTAQGRRSRVTDNDLWIEVKEDIALEKIKQALRQQSGEQTKSDSVNDDDDAETEEVPSPNDNFPDPQVASSLATSSSLPSFHGSSSLSSSVGLLGVGAASMGAVDARLLLFNHQLIWQLQQQQQRQLLLQRLALLQREHTGTTLPSIGDPSQGAVATASAASFPARMLSQRLPQDAGMVMPESLPFRAQHVTAAPASAPSHENVVDGGIQGGNVSSAGQEEAATEPSASHDPDAVFALSALAVAGRPMFTDEQRRLEQAQLTDEERMSVLTDKFGKRCCDRQTKRRRRDLDADSLAFLVTQMKLELERTPSDCKRALIEAQAKCSPDEFSDSRLLQFLRCEDMNVKLAAQRFTKYWECRRQVFTPEKFCLPMTLSEALREDLPAIEEGVLCLLPHKDLSGRPLLFIDPHRRTGVGYTSESLLRAFWYVIEVAGECNRDTSSGCVFIGWDKETTIWDFPRQVYDRFIEFERSCFPIRLVAVHSCCPKSAAMKIMRPILLALTDKRVRTRNVVHNVPEGEIVQALLPFGIRREMLPRVMGGEIELDQRQWIANRRAGELKEIG